tara:strand:+ start:1826 stop:2179 length:354 start_codon:yes stop_codon:yes gene_type:complete
MQGGVRVPYTIELDSQSTVIAEYTATTDTDHAVAVRRSRTESPVKGAARTMARWATRAVEDNPISGTDDLRSQYFIELDKMVKAHSSKGRSCPGCEIGKLIRRFRGKLEAAGHLQEG